MFVTYVICSRASSFISLDGWEETKLKIEKLFHNSDAPYSMTMLKYFNIPKNIKLDEKARSSFYQPFEVS